MSSFHIGQLHVKEGLMDNLISSFDMLKEQPGFISQTIYVSDQDADKLTTVEQWGSKQDHDNFMASMSEDAIGGWMSMFVTPPTSDFFTKI